MIRVCLVLSSLGTVACRSGFDPRAAPVDGTQPADTADATDATELADAAPACTAGPFTADFQVLPSWATPYESGAATWRLTGGALEVDVRTATPDSAAGLRSAAFTFRNLRIVIQIPVMVNTSDAARAYMCVADCQTQPFQGLMYQERGDLVVEAAAAGGLILRRPYDAITDRFWQVRETNGMTHWETSPDGMAWAKAASYATPPAADTAELWLGAVNNDALDGGKVTFTTFRSCLEP